MSFIKTAVWPVAGLGTRWKPQSEFVPKELLPIHNYPVLSFSLNEAIEAGVENFIFISSKEKPGLNDYLRQWQTEHPEFHVEIIWQDEPKGLGHAVGLAEDFIRKNQDDYFAVISPDDIVLGAEYSCLKQMVDAFQKQPSNYMAVMPVEKSQTKSYGMISYAKENPPFFEVNGMVEKPEPSEAPSEWAIIGRYILHQTIFDLLATQAPGKGGEIQLTDAMQTLLSSQSFRGYAFDGKRFDTGQVPGWLEANIFFEEQKGKQ